MIYIVTVTYNDCKNLQLTIASIRKYKKVYHKFIVIDGKSTDNTLDVIIDNQDIIDGFLSEKDEGIYDAMNKITRFDIEEHDFIIWINAGDELTDWKSFNESFYKEYDCIFAGVIKKSARNILQNGIRIIPKIYTPYNEKNFYPKTIYQHQGFFIKYSIFKNILYNTNIGLQAENLLMSKCIQYNKFIVLDFPVSVYYADGISNNSTYEILKSYIAVTKQLKFSMLKICFYKWKFFVKAIIYSMLPRFLRDSYKKIKYK